MPRPPEPEPAPRGSIPDGLRRRGIRDPRLLQAFGRLSRARFLPPELRDQADVDRPLPIGWDQTIGQPFVVAVMTLELALTGVERVLEIGTASGYQTAILSDLAAEVFTIERQPTLSLRARGLLDGLGRTNIHYQVGDGTVGWPEEAPFDRILVTVASLGIPRPLFEQLVEGGLMVLPIGDAALHDLTVVRKSGGKAAVRNFLPRQFLRLINQGGSPE